MRFAALAALAAAFVFAATSWAPGPGPWRMHDPLDWGMWLGPLAIVVLLALSVAGVVALARWRGGRRGGRVQTPRDILDERYARGEIDREGYLRRRDDIAGRS
jgi:putative membrane protein